MYTFDWPFSATLHTHTYYNVCLPFWLFARESVGTVARRVAHFTGRERERESVSV